MRRRRIDPPGKTKAQMVQAAEEAGWIAAVDFRSKRVLFFCCPACEEAAKTKRGFYRKARPIVQGAR